MEFKNIFSGIVVVELASVLAGPSVGMFLAELGATVIKVENPTVGGDITRSWKLPIESTDSLSAYFCSVNWGKKSIALDFNSQDDLIFLNQLIQKADIVIGSFKTGDDIKYNLDYESVVKINPTIIYGRITGFSSSSQRLAYDAIIQAESGFMYLNGTPESGPLKMPVALIDVLAGHQLKEAILLSILNKFKTGKGSFVEVSLLQTAVASLVNQGSNFLVAGQIPVSLGSEHPNIFPYGTVLRSSDGDDFVIAVSTNAQFASLCRLLKLEFDDHLMDSNQERVRQKQAIRPFLAESFVENTTQWLSENLEKRKIPFGLIRNLADVFQLKEAKELLIHNGGLFGVKSAVFQSGETVSLTPPPSLNADEKWIKEWAARAE